jgi:sec-independent protein translocase protein TatB
MWNIGFGELAIICIVLIIAVGPERLPSMMKTVGKTVRTLRQASRDLRESTGIDELLREDFDYRPPLRKPDPPVGPAIARDAELVMDPTSSPLAPVTARAPGDPDDPGAPVMDVAAASLPSDGPLTAATPDDSSALNTPPAASPIAEPVAQAEPAEHANVGSTLPSDAPLESNAQPLAAAHAPVPPLPHDPVPSASQEREREIEAKPRET